MKDKKIGVAVCGSFCTFSQVLPVVRRLARDNTVTAVLSPAAGETDTRFYRAEDFVRELTELCGRAPITTLAEAEQVGPKQLFDVLLVAPCTGNTLAKLANGIADTAVTMAAKAHLRNGRPVVLAISTNDGLGGAARNLGELLCRKHYYFVPFRQDDPVEKPTSLVADMTKVTETVTAALRGQQLQPVLLGPEKT